MSNKEVIEIVMIVKNSNSKVIYDNCIDIVKEVTYNIIDLITYCINI